MLSNKLCMVLMERCVYHTDKQKNEGSGTDGFATRYTWYIQTQSARYCITLWHAGYELTERQMLHYLKARRVFIQLTGLGRRHSWFQLKTKQNLVRRGMPYFHSQNYSGLGQRHIWILFILRSTQHRVWAENARRVFVRIMIPV